MIDTLLFIAITIVIVGLHESGHMIAALFCKMKVHEYAIGFWKVLFSFEHKGIKYSFRALPLGGYVDIEKEDMKNHPWRRLVAILAGPGFSFLFGWMMIFYACFSNTPDFSVALDKSFVVISIIITSMINLLSFNINPEDIGGAVTIATSATKAVNTYGFEFGFFLYAGAISFWLGLLNMLPLPMLDGGQAIIAVKEGISGKSIGEKMNRFLMFSSFVMVVLLTVVVNGWDIYKTFVMGV